MSDWEMKKILKKLKYRLLYGRVKSDFVHVSIIAGCIVGNLPCSYKCPPGKAYLAMKAWVKDFDSSADLLSVLGRDIGFRVEGKIEIYKTYPDSPPKEYPYGYDINFVPYHG